MGWQDVRDDGGHADDRDADCLLMIHSIRSFSKNMEGLVVNTQSHFIDISNYSALFFHDISNTFLYSLPNLLECVLIKLNLHRILLNNLFQFHNTLPIFLNILGQPLFINPIYLQPLHNPIIRFGVCHQIDKLCRPVASQQSDYLVQAADGGGQQLFREVDFGVGRG